MSVMRVFSRLDALMMVCTYSCRFSGGRSAFRSSSAVFRITARGVLISWLTVEKNSVFSVSMEPRFSTILLKSWISTST